MGWRVGTVDDINPALPMIRNLPPFPQIRVLQVMQDLYRQQYLFKSGVRLWDVQVPDSERSVQLTFRLRFRVYCLGFIRVKN